MPQEDRGARARPGRLLGVQLDDVRWLTSSRTRARLDPGEFAPREVQVPARAVNALLREHVVRVVADLPRGATPEVVWEQPPHELLVRTDRTRASISSGLVVITVEVACDQTDELAVDVPLAVGTVARPAGLVMATLDEVAAPPAIAGPWSDAITAFAWECLVELCRRLAAEVGDDARGRALVPGDVVATSRGQLRLRAMARHDRTLRIAP